MIDPPKNDSDTFLHRVADPRFGQMYLNEDFHMTLASWNLKLKTVDLALGNATTWSTTLPKAHFSPPIGTHATCSGLDRRGYLSGACLVYYEYETQEEGVRCRHLIAKVGTKCTTALDEAIVKLASIDTRPS